HFANTIIDHPPASPVCRQLIPPDSPFSFLMAVIREKEETLKQRVIRALAGFSGYGRVMVVGGGAEIVAPAIREACGVNATFIADGVPQFALVNGLYAMDKE
ncbi:stability/partitioning protein, partial [Escherichia coli]